MKRFSDVDAYLQSLGQWQVEIARLREILLTTGLDETIKWNSPCYTHQGKNVVGIGGFKSYFGLWFFQGALMDDPESLLVNAQKGKTRGMRQWRMASKNDIKVQLVKRYVKEAVRVAESGLSIQPKRDLPVEIHPLLEAALRKNRQASKAFEQMSPSCRREYANYINEAKKEETKIRRLAKIIPMIASGGGLNDRYRKR